MALAPWEFSYVDTTTEKKLDVIKWQIGIVQRSFDISKMTGYCIGIPGRGEQCARHQKEYSSYGIEEKNQVMVDYDYLVHLTQKVWATNSKFSGTIIHGNILDVLNDYHFDKKQVDIVDYDGVSHMHDYHEEAIRLASQRGIKVFILVVTNRCNKLTSFHSRWKARLGLHAVMAKSGSMKGKLSEPISKIQRGAVHEIAKECGYESLRINSFMRADSISGIREPVTEINLLPNPEYMGSKEELDFDWSMLKSNMYQCDYLTNEIEIWSTAQNLNLGFNPRKLAEFYLVSVWHEPVGEFILTRFRRFEDSKGAKIMGYTMTYAFVEAEHRRQGLGPKFYRALLDSSTIIVSDKDQTAMSRRVWDKLAQAYYVYLYDIRRQCILNRVDNTDQAYENARYLLVASAFELDY